MSTAAVTNPCGPPVVNPVACENTQAGDPPSDWSISEPGDSTIQGFAADQSVNAGQTVNFKVNTSATNYHLDILRFGWYQGNGARKVAAGLRPSILLVLFGPQKQPACKVDTTNTTGLVDCGNWATSVSWGVPANAVSGIYAAHLVRDDTGGSSYIFFVVRSDASHSSMVYQTDDVTREAYNQYGGNSLYTCTVACPAGNPAVYKSAYKVSFNRPNTAAALGGEYSFFGAEFQMVEFLEANGYDVSYISGVDTDRAGALLKNHHLFISSGHDEYWSGNQRANVEAAQAAGVNLAFFSANEVFWKTRYENSIDGSNTANRTLVSYKETHFSAPVDPKDPPTWTGTWRDPSFSPPADGGRPENALTGTAYTVDPPNSFALQVPSTDGKLRFWRNTAVANLAPGQTATLAPNTLGYEWDEDLDNGFRPAGNFDVSTTTESVSAHLTDYGNTEIPGVATHHLTMHRAASGALVFGAGTVQWSWGLEGSPDGSAGPDVNMEQATINLFADMGIQPVTLIGGLVAASSSADTVAPTSTITSPAPNSAAVANTSVTVTGTAADLGGGRVGGVEVSVDGGATWHPAAGREAWSYTWTPTTAGTATIRSRAVDDSANLETSSAGVSLTITPRSCPCSVWNSSAVPQNPSVNDPASIEVGVKLHSDVSGYILGIRFYKGTGNTGTHVGHLWTTGGTMLASATFTGESATGWQQVYFATPVAVTAGTDYVASYFAPAGHYSGDTVSFSANGYDAPPLHVLKDGANGANGVYAYGTGAFPTTRFEGTNYWVDVLFNQTPVPTVSSTTPVPGDTGISTVKPLTATFSESVRPATINFTMTDPSNNIVPSTLTYNDTNHTASLQPNAALSYSTKYTANLSGAIDAAGNPMPSPSTWSFTTTGPPATCPCTIWPPSVAPIAASVADTGSVELGVKFHSDQNGYITAIRFYKGSGNTGSHVGHLWTAAGGLLATATFTGESATGWQQVNLSTPVAVTAGTDYVASYFAPVGHYAADKSYFAIATDSPPLHALRDGSNGGNGVYSYGVSAFPTTTYQSSNYWVDVVFNVSQPLTVVAQSPTPGATGVATASAVTAGFNQSVQAATVSFTLTDSSNNVVPSTVAYNDTNHTATLQPNAALAYSTTYKATLSSAVSASGSALTGPVTWSFSTTGPPSACPCSIWSPAAVPSNPAASDAGSVELGVKFHADVNGHISGVRFYKGSTNTGTHIGNLWTVGGTLLASATFTGETASGWQQVNFATPVAVTAGTDYVASYYAPVGHYAIDSSYFTSAGVDNPPLHALKDGADGGNGVYVYGVDAFPSNSYQGGNYWVDVVLTTP